MINEHWRKKRLGEVATLQRGFDLPNTKRTEGIFPVISSGGIHSHHNEYRVKGPGVVTGRYGSIGEVYFVEGDYWPLNTTLWVKDFHGNDPKFVFHLLKTFDFNKFSDKTGVPGVNRNDLHKVLVSCPPLNVQKRIVECLSLWDITIEKTERLIEVKEKRFSWLISRLISRGNHTCGHIRDFTTEVSERNSAGEIDRVLSVTNDRGFVLPKDQFERQVASSNLSNYKIVTKRQYAYNPSRINVGSIARLDDWDKGVLSPMYVVFKINEGKVSSDFFLHWLSSHEAKERIRKSAQGSVRETVSFTDFGSIPFPLPLLEQQKYISDLLNTARQEIDILKKQADAYRKQKRGLMQKLLTGEWRVKGE